MSRADVTLQVSSANQILWHNARNGTACLLRRASECVCLNLTGPRTAACKTASNKRSFTWTVFWLKCNVNPWVSPCISMAYILYACANEFLGHIFANTLFRNICRGDPCALYRYTNCAEWDPVVQCRWPTATNRCSRCILVDCSPDCSWRRRCPANRKSWSHSFCFPRRLDRWDSSGMQSLLATAVKTSGDDDDDDAVMVKSMESVVEIRWVALVVTAEAVAWPMACRKGIWDGVNKVAGWDFVGANPGWDKKPVTAARRSSSVCIGKECNASDGAVAVTAVVTHSVIRWALRKFGIGELLATVIAHIVCWPAT